MVAIIDKPVSWAPVINACTYTQNYLMAGDPNAPKDALRDLATSEDSKIRLRVAENIAAPSSVLIQLAFDANPEIRTAVAENSSTPSSVKEFLANDDCADVRYAIAENAHADQGILHRLAYDDNPYVSARARKTLAAVSAATPPQVVVVENFRRLLEAQTVV